MAIENSHRTVVVITPPDSKLFDLKWMIVKRAIDLILCLIFIPVCFPLLFLLAIIVRLETPGNPIFKQRRIGQNGKSFTIYKFRTLYKHHFGLIADQEEPADYRITPIGKFLRRSKIDELPQLLNILFGEMSFVGPRPYTPNEFDFDKEADTVRLFAKPGLTGVAQISGNTTLGKRNIAWLDIWYIENYSISLDLKILAFTCSAIIDGNANHHDRFNLYSRLPAEKPEPVSADPEPVNTDQW